MRSEDRIALLVWVLVDLRTPVAGHSASLTLQLLLPNIWPLVFIKTSQNSCYSDPQIYSPLCFLKYMMNRSLWEISPCFRPAFSLVPIQLITYLPSTSGMSFLSCELLWETKLTAVSMQETDPNLWVLVQPSHPTEKRLTLTFWFQWSVLMHILMNATCEA